MSAGKRHALSSASFIAAAAPVPSGSGDVMWYASAVSPYPRSFTAGIPSGASFVITKYAAPSPSVIPCLFALNGSVMSDETASSESNPRRTVSLVISTPPAITASARPLLINSAALISAPALDEHAVLNESDGPVTPYFSEIYDAG